MLLMFASNSQISRDKGIFTGLLIKKMGYCGVCLTYSDEANTVSAKRCTLNNHVKKI